MPRTRHAHATHTPRTCRAHAVHMPCTCRAHATHKEHKAAWRVCPFERQRAQCTRVRTYPLFRGHHPSRVHSLKGRPSRPPHLSTRAPPPPSRSQARSRSWRCRTRCSPRHRRTPSGPPYSISPTSASPKRVRRTGPHRAAQGRTGPHRAAQCCIVLHCAYCVVLRVLYQHPHTRTRRDADERAPHHGRRPHLTRKLPYRLGIELQILIHIVGERAESRPTCT